MEEVQRFQGTASLTKAWHPSALSKTGDKSAVLPREGLKELFIQNRKVIKEFHSLKSCEAASRWEEPGP
jgi:hypothetical protein